MKCTESFGVRDFWVECNNPASVSAMEYKHGVKRGICSFCLWRRGKEDDVSFFERHELTTVDAYRI